MITKILSRLSFFTFFINCAFNVNAAYHHILPYDMKNFDQVIQQRLTVFPKHRLSPAQRHDLISRSFLGQPYILSSAGEGEKALFDQNPLYRTDAFDCMTFVNVVLALDASQSLDDFKKNYLKINYANNLVNFESRLHFASPDWNGKNQKNDFLEDVTEQLFPNQVLVDEIIIDKPEWFKRLTDERIQSLKPLTPDEVKQKLDALHAKANEVRPEIAKVTYLSLNQLFDEKEQPIKAQFAKIPDYALIEIVRPHWDLRKQIGTYMNISHMGFAVRKNGVLNFREASSLEKKVIDIPLEKYLHNYLHSQTVRGIHIEKITIK